MLLRGQFGKVSSAEKIPAYRFAEAVHQPVSVIAPLNGYALWVTLMIALTVSNYGVPIYELATRAGTAVPAVYIGGAR